MKTEVMKLEILKQQQRTTEARRDGIQDLPVDTVLGEWRSIFSIMRGEKEKNKHVKRMKKEHAQTIHECQWKVREKWSEDEP